MKKKKLHTRNNFEESVYKKLRRSKVAFEYEAERVKYTIASVYVPDFVIIREDNTKLYIETKGYLRPEDKRKLVAVKKCNPEIDLRILFQVHNLKYIRWAERNKIPWAVGKIPKEWFIQ